jgi:hypothetical protein
MSDTDFKYLMSVAGYSIKSVNMGVGIVPRFSLYFGQTREMSDADEIYLARLLRKHECTMGGPDQPAAHRPFTARRRATAMATPMTSFSAGWSSGTLSTWSLVMHSFRMPCASLA